MKKIILNFVFILFIKMSFGQHCGDLLDQKDSLHLKKYLSVYSSHEKLTEPYLKIIPVVFHVLHNNGVGNVSEQTLRNTIQRVNENYRKRNADTTNINYPFDLIHPDMKIEFSMACIDEFGNSVNGITRHDTSITISAFDNVKQVERWPNNEYLNIWVVNYIVSGSNAYTYLPGASNNLDGIVITYDNLDWLEHEIGHWLGLLHTFGMTNDEELAANCNDDDGIEDTPNCIGISSCPTIIRNTCVDNSPFLSFNGDTIYNGDVEDNYQNYMEYPHCSSNNFTEGQRDFTHSTLSSIVNGRNNLWSELNLIKTGVARNNSCIVFADASLSYDSLESCYNEEIFLNAEVVDTSYAYNWSYDSLYFDFIYSGNDTLILVPNSVGYFEFTMKVSNKYGEEQNNFNLIVSECDSDINFIKRKNEVIYSNPTQSNIEIDLGVKYNDIDVFIYTLEGKLLFKKEFKQADKLDVQTKLVSGLYYVKINYDDNILIDKLVVK